MRCDVVVVVVLYVVGFVLPTVGLVRLLADARSELTRARQAFVQRPGNEGRTEFNIDWEGHRLVVDKPQKRVRDIWIDLVLIGGGMLAGAIAGIWSLFMTPPSG